MATIFNSFIVAFSDPLLSLFDLREGCHLCGIPEVGVIAALCGLAESQEALPVTLGAVGDNSSWMFCVSPLKEVDC